mmetsp:Transcript_36061/g.89996  ORF Transcript_36061/g.89996 Transcript_36061/m.89996 type:complete len:217 (-) Transcript_36061:683-1333(-)
MTVGGGGGGSIDLIHWCVLQSRTTGSARTSAANLADNVTASSESSSVMQSARRLSHRRRPSTAASPPPSSPPPTPRLHARRHRPSITASDEDSSGTNSIPRGNRSRISRPHQIPPPAVRDGITSSCCRRAPILNVATTSAFRALVTWRTARPATLLMDIRPTAGPAVLVELSLRPASEAASTPRYRNGSRTSFTIWLCIKLFRSCAERSSEYRSRL